MECVEESIKDFRTYSLLVLFLDLVVLSSRAAGRNSIFSLIEDLKAFVGSGLFLRFSEF